MKRYNVTVNGNIYQVEVEEVKGEFTSAPQPVAPKAAPQAPKTAAPKKSNASGEKVTSPMPGTIVKINATNGATVKKGDVLFVLEAMKMENEIMSPVDGVVADVNVAKGAAVNTGDVLAVIG
ncbi:biotin/lipoyl-containing protein [Clostridium ihumii]|uniref:biotin/lipoyl-containing protein n=1 Tax=Clostridium ihumii TaxID=1470356 RepID=UPI00058CAC48|nr:biotin/lipoyl-containing protein [Clostridium ihumii]